MAKPVTPLKVLDRECELRRRFRAAGSYARPSADSTATNLDKKPRWLTVSSPKGAPEKPQLSST